MADRTITTDLIGRDRMSPAFESAGRSAQRSGGIIGKVGSAMGTALKAGAVVAGGGLLAVGAWMAQGVKDAVSYETVLKKTAAVLKSTGGASGQTVEGIKDQAAALETLSGVDEELIINSENVLATFTNIKNVGKNKIFDEATKSSLDMSVALGTDLQGASILVGKALNDPVKGMTALSKSGVTFTDAQKKVVKEMVKTGDTAGAQKLILAELGKEFGGAAKAAGSGAAGDWARFQDVIADTGRSIGQALLPTLTTVMKFLNEKLPPAIEFATTAFHAFIGAFQEGDVTSDGVIGKVEKAGVKAAAAFRTAKSVVGGFVDVIKTPAFQVFAQILGVMGAQLVVVAGAVKAYTAAQAVLNAVMAINPASIVILGIAALIAIFVVAWKRSQTFREVMSTAFAIMSTAVLTYVEIIIKAAHNMTMGVLEAVGGVLNAIAKIPGPTQDAAKKAAKGFDDFKTGVDKTFTAAENKVAGWKTAVAKMPQQVKLEGNISDLNTKIDAAKEKLKTVPKSKQSAIRADIAQLQKKVRDAKAALATLKNKTIYVNVAGSASVSQKRAAVGKGIPLNAKGGPAFKGQPMVVGDGGRAELFVPDANGVILPKLPDPGAGGRPYGGGGGDTYYNLYLQGSAIATKAELRELLIEAVASAPAGSRKIPASAVARA